MRNHPMRTHPEADACRIKVIRIRVGPHEGVPQYEGAASQSETGMRIREIERTSTFLKFEIPWSLSDWFIGQLGIGQLVNWSFSF